MLLALVVVASVLVRADGDPARPTNAELVQIEDCLDLRIAQAPARQSAAPDGGISLRGLAAMLGIGALTIMFFVPAALLSELLMRRGKSPRRPEALGGTLK
ncbi:hypothetical protein DWB85_01555 [Seongchinamella sediminis]|uniref:Uncharacterized protein n=2 Tax=Seongchinamella sediminis TaxID=2283635 RepID=A0A3L7E4B5_9GAMM|nr:hypothetical protein DWB85_01555 [Seongchinamella sediminis]